MFSLNKGVNDNSSSGNHCGISLNAEFDKKVTIKPDDDQWLASPMSGVERVMLDRVGDQSNIYRTLCSKQFF